MAKQEKDYSDVGDQDILYQAPPLNTSLTQRTTVLLAGLVSWMFG